MIVESASAVLVIVGVLSFVSEISTNEEGAFGAVVSMVIEIDEDSEEIFPAASVALASRE